MRARVRVWARGGVKDGARSRERRGHLVRVRVRARPRMARARVRTRVRRAAWSPRARRR